MQPVPAQLVCKTLAPKMFSGLKLNFDFLLFSWGWVADARGMYVSMGKGVVGM